MPMYLLFSQAPNPERSRTLLPFLEHYGAVLVAAVLGLLAVYLLLPRVRRYPAALGALVGVAALVLAGWWLIRPEPVLVETVLFYIFAGLAILFGGLMITQVSPVRAALCFAMVILNTCGLFLLQAAPFLMAATIIIYAGAIIVTFLFVIMLAQQSGLDSADMRSREPLLACVAGFVLLAALLCVLQRDYGPTGNPDLLARVNKYLDDDADGEKQHFNSSHELSSKINEYTKRIETALKASTPDELKKALVETDTGDLVWVDKFQKIVKALESAPPNARNYKNTIVDELGEVNQPDKVKELDDPDSAKQTQAEIQDHLKNVIPLVWRLQNEVLGHLIPDSRDKLSRFSGPPMDEAPRDVHGRAKMPADNVAALGRSLFSDYLVGVELAATLLLVASIGAIVIAGRKGEGLK